MLHSDAGATNGQFLTTATPRLSLIWLLDGRRPVIALTNQHALRALVASAFS
jgi:hypothetical protein